jgi:enoyl-CoA hydratase/carnithine racemase
LRSTEYAPFEIDDLRTTQLREFGFFSPIPPRFPSSQIDFGMSKHAELSFSHGGRVAHLKLKNPRRRNALSAKVLREFQEAVRLVRERCERPFSPITENAQATKKTQKEEEESPPSILVLSGEGKAFCGGFDLSAFTVSSSSSEEEEQEGEQTDDGIESLERSDAAYRAGAMAWGQLIHDLEALPVVKIGVLHGAVVGGGVVLASVCDVRVCAVTTRLRLPEVAMGLPLLWGGASRLVREVGLSRARRWILLSEDVPVDELRSSGFAEVVGDPHATEEEARGAAVARGEEIAKKLLNTSRFAVDFSRSQLASVGEALIPTKTLSAADGDVIAFAALQPAVRARLLKYTMSKQRSGGAKL